jgi:hypothetical protein
LPSRFATGPSKAPAEDLQEECASFYGIPSLGVITGIARGGRSATETGLGPDLPLADLHHVPGHAPPNDKAYNARERAAYERCMQAIAENGWGFYGAYNAFHDKLMGLLSYDTEGTLRVGHCRPQDGLRPHRSPRQARQGGVRRTLPHVPRRFDVT